MIEKLDRWEGMEMSSIFEELDLFFHNDRERHSDDWDIDKILSEEEQEYLMERIEDEWDDRCCVSDMFVSSDPYEMCGTCKLFSSIYAIISKKGRITMKSKSEIEQKLREKESEIKHYSGSPQFDYKRGKIDALKWMLGEDTDE